MADLRLELSGMEDRSEDETRRLLEFAERLFANAAALWDAGTLDQRQRLQQAFFPDGLTYSSEGFRTGRICQFFSPFRTRPAGKWRNGVPNQIRPRVTPVCHGGLPLDSTSADLCAL